MSIDQLVSRDLATTAAANRVNPRTLAATLRAAGAIREPAPAPVSAGGGLRWLALGEIYASRVARASAGLAALAALVVTVAFNAAKTLHLLPYRARWFGGEPLAVGVLLFAAVLLVRIAARGWASRTFARAAEIPGRPERMVAASDRWALALGIAGPFAFALAFGIAYFVLRSDPLDYFACATDLACWGPDGDATAYTSRLRDLAILVPVGIVGAFAIARWPPPGRVVRWNTIIACIVLLATLTVGLRFDDGPWPQNLADGNYVPSPVLRQILMITGSVGLFGLLAGLALWRRHAENERIASASS